MMLAGDEFGHTQRGNNNAYCQDNDITWLDWDGITEEGKALIQFTRRLLMLRRELPILRRSRFLGTQFNEELGVKDATWIAVDGKEMRPEEWQNGELRSVGMLLDGRAQTSGIKRPASDATVLLTFNSHHLPVNFVLPVFAGGTEWICLIDTSDPARYNQLRFKTGEAYQLESRSLAFFAALTPGEPGQTVEAIALELEDPRKNGDAKAEKALPGPDKPESGGTP